MPSYIVYPNEDLGPGWTEQPAGPAYSCIDDRVVAPTAPDTTDYITSTTDAAACLLGFESVSIPNGERVVEIKAWIYGKTAGAAFGATLMDGNSGSALPNAGSYVVGASYAWTELPLWEGNLSAYQLDVLRLNINQIGTSASFVAAVYLEFVTVLTAEEIVLDPAEIALGRTELDLTAGPIDVKVDGIDWGDAAVEAFYAEQTYGEVVVDRRVPNREITIPLLLKETYDVSFAAARGLLQQKVGRIQAEGQGWLKRVTANAGVVYADLVGASLQLPGSWEQAHQKRQTDAVLILQALPDFYGEEIALTDHAETSAAELVFLETDLKGDGPARMRIVIDDDQGRDQKALIWAIRSRYYSNDPLAAVAFEAEALTPQDTAASAVALGASGGSAMAHTTLSTDWTPVLSTYVAGKGHMTHEGTYRCFARVLSSSNAAVRVRMVYDVGDLTNPTQNDPWRTPAANGWYIADLGELQLQRVPLGGHRWIGQLQAAGDAGGENVYIDKLWIVNVDDGMGICRASSDNQDITFSNFAAHDEFNQSAGAVTGKTLPVGGTWQGSGSATDFAMDTTNHRITRATTGDVEAAFAGARFIRASATSAATQRAQVDLKRSLASTGGQLSQGVLLRYVDTSNFLVSLVQAVGSVDGNLSTWSIWKVVGGTVTALAYYFGSVHMGQADVWYRMSCTADSAGRWSASLGVPTSPSLWTLSGQDDALATGGALAAGTVGIYDLNASATASVRTYDNFAAVVPNPDAVVFANQSAQLTSRGAYRQDSGGVAYGPISVPEGDLPRLPAPGMENRPVEVFLKLSRGDLDQLPDSGIDDLSAQIFYRPSWLFAASVNADTVGPP